MAGEQFQRSSIVFGAVILAAGASRRMGKPKLLLPWGDKTVLEHTVATWTRLGAKQVGVVWSDAQPVVAEVAARISSKCFAIKNPDAGSEMWASIQTAAQWNGWDASVTHIAIVLGDQPHVAAATLEDFLRSIPPSEGTNVWQPAVNGKRCHPVVLERSVFAQIAGSEGPSLREFLDRHAGTTELVAMSDEAMLRDIDFPEDWNELSPKRRGGHTPGL